MDLPNIVGGAEANITILQTLYTDLNTTYDTYNTNYVTFETTTPKLSIMLGATDLPNGLTESRIYAIDLPSAGLVNFPVSPETIKEAFVERIGIDLDEGGISLRNYEIVTAIFPQSSFDSSTSNFTWKVGSADLPNNPVVWYSTQTFYPSSDYKLDMRVAGRYLAYRVSTTALENFKFSGFDVDVQQLSRR